MRKIADDSMMCKTVKIKENELTALIDTGSKHNIMTMETYKNLNVKLAETNVYLIGFENKNNKDRAKPFDEFEQYFIIDNDLILGEKFCKQTEIKITRNRITIKKTKKKKKTF